MRISDKIRISSFNGTAHVDLESKGGRCELNRIQGEVYKNLDALLETCNDLFGEGCYTAWSMDDFMELYNGSDDESQADDTLVVADTFFGYVYVE